MRVLAWLIALPLSAVLGLFVYSWWRERGFNGDHPPPGKFHSDSHVHAVDSLGAEPAVVFVHGNPGSCLDFTPVMERLSPKLRTLAFDRPGYGWSPRPDPFMTPVEQAHFIHDAVKHLGLTRPVIAGFSYGGPVAIAYALEFPREVGALVLLAAVGHPDEKHVLSEAQARLLTPTGPLIAWGLGPILGPDAVASGYVDAFSPKPVDEGVVERGRWLFTRPPTLLASVRDWHVLETELPRLAARYGELTAPVEILSANQDRIIGPKHAAYLSNHLKGSHKVDVDDAGHQLMATHTQAVVDAVLRAVARRAP
ncbi:MAG: alpha/beta hydrolase [Myxococcaceae bacterium]|nr:alpha/beta hydrolase [Myxococcaceae bacterium]